MEASCSNHGEDNREILPSSPHELWQNLKYGLSTGNLCARLHLYMCFFKNLIFKKQSISHKNIKFSVLKIWTIWQHYLCIPALPGTGL